MGKLLPYVRGEASGEPEEPFSYFARSARTLQ